MAVISVNWNNHHYYIHGALDGEGGLGLVKWDVNTFNQGYFVLWQSLDNHLLGG